MGFIYCLIVTIFSNATLKSLISLTKLIILPIIGTAYRNQLNMPSHFCTIKHKKKGYTECRFWMLLNLLKSYSLWNHCHENISEVVAFNVKSLACLSFSLAAFFARDERRTALNVDVIINLVGVVSSTGCFSVSSISSTQLWWSQLIGCCWCEKNE